MLTALPLLRGAVILLFLPLAIVLPAAYFRALRPRRGTTEWMRRLDPPKFQPIAARPLHRYDLFWGALGTLSAGALWLLVLFFRTGWFLTEAPWRFLWLAEGYYLPRLPAAAALGAGVYLLLRSWCSRSSVAFWGALLSPLLFFDHPAGAAGLSLALWCFRQWMTADPEACWFRRAVYLLPAVLCYGLSLVLCWPCVFLAPLFVAGYIRTLIYRWLRDGGRVGNLLLTLGLTLLLGLCAVLGVWILYGFVSGTNRDWSALGDPGYYGQMLPTFLEQFRGLFQRPDLRETLSHGELLPLLLGLGALLPLCHGLFKGRDESCLHSLLLLLALLAIWLVCGEFLLPLGLLLAWGWTWETCSARGRRGAVWGVALGLILFLLADTVLILFGRFT